MTTLRRRLTLLLLGAFITVWSTAILLTWVNVRSDVEQRFDRQLAQTSQVIWLLFANAETPETRLDDAYTARVLQRFGINQALQVWRGSELLLRSGNAPETRMAEHYGASSGPLAGAPWRFYYRVDALRGLDVIVGQAESERAALIREIVLGIAWPVLLALPLLAILIMLAIGQGLTPLNSLARRLGRRSPTDLSPMPLADVPGEIQPLTAALNDLLGRLATALENERRFTANASHELRTPLAALKTQAQLAQRAQSDTDRRDALEQVIAGVDRATHLVERLLTLARLDPDVNQSVFETADLGAIARSVIAELDPSARDRGIDVGLSATDACLIRGIPGALHILLRNLIDNAIRYAPADSHVDIEIEADGPCLHLRVCDQGPGIPSHERHRMFERFQRGAAPRGTGSGLGLSIVARICALHDAKIRLEDGKDGRGLTVHIRFPLGSTGC